MPEFKWILSVCAAVTTIGGACAVIYKTMKPYRDWKNQTLECNARFTRDKVALDELRRDTREIMDAVCTLLHHAATGNSVDKCKEKHDELMTYLAKK